MKSVKRQRRLIQCRIANTKNKYFKMLEQHDYIYDLMYSKMHQGGMIMYPTFFHCQCVLKETCHEA